MVTYCDSEKMCDRSLSTLCGYWAGSSGFRATSRPDEQLDVIGNAAGARDAYLGTLPYLTYLKVCNARYLYRQYLLIVLTDAIKGSLPTNNCLMDSGCTVRATDSVRTAAERPILSSASPRRCLAYTPWCQSTDLLSLARLRCAAHLSPEQYLLAIISLIVASRNDIVNTLPVNFQLRTLWVPRVAHQSMGFEYTEYTQADRSLSAVYKARDLSTLHTGSARIYPQSCQSIITGGIQEA